MAAATLRLPIHGPNQEHRCNKHQTPRYYELKWRYLGMSVEGVENAIVGSGFQYNFYAAFLSQPILSLEAAGYYSYNGLAWDKDEEAYFEHSLYVLVDTGVIKNCTTSCQEIDLSTIQLGDCYPSVKSFRAGGLRFYNTYGVPLEDRKTVFDRVYQRQKQIQSWKGKMLGSPVVKCVQYWRVKSGEVMTAVRSASRVQCGQMFYDGDRRIEASSHSAAQQADSILVGERCRRRGRVCT
ncbi:hypothetical protein J3E71DRAFT_171848 [Bipolaris maydis]|nr:hypothetical protein J3E71DRAFT_171848 [Bipolaris maydis]